MGSRGQTILGISILAVGIVVGVAVRCPSASQAFVMIICVAFGIGMLIFGLTGQFDLHLKARGITGSGAGALFLIFFFCKPTILGDMTCDKFTLFGRVARAHDFTLGIAHARVTIYSNLSTTLRANALGDFQYSYGRRDVGSDIQVWAEATGYKRSQPIVITLATVEDTVRVPLQPLADQLSTVLLPDVSAKDSPPVAQEVKPENYGDALRANNGDELALARWGTAAFKKGDFDWSIKFLEDANRSQKTGIWKYSAPYLVAAYLNEGEKQKAEILASSLEADLQSGTGYLSYAGRKRFLAEAARDASESLENPEQRVILDGIAKVDAGAVSPSRGQSP